jgi:uncharacterized phage protein (TIGR02218 family)
MSFWGKWFGKKTIGGRVRSKWFGRWFGEGLPPGTVPPVTPSTASSFVLEDDVKVTYAWQTGLHKSFDGRETRSSIVEDPAARFEGSMLHGATTTRANRAKLARFAAQGAAFALGLPWEGVPIKSDSTGNTLFLESTVKLDWAVPGMRAIVKHLLYGSAEVVVQSKTSTTITVYVPSLGVLGNIGKYGAVIMPAPAVFLDAQQGFQRYQVNLERWDVRARNANSGFESAAVTARLALSSVTGDSVLAGVTIEARTAGAAGNSITVQFIGDGTTLGSLTENVGLKTIVVHFSPGATPVGRLSSLFASSTLAKANGATGITPMNGTFAATALAGGIDGGTISPGLGATVTTFLGRPVWDRGLDVTDTTAESIQAMNDPQDLGGLPFTAQTARVPDWGRSIAFSRKLASGEWQWTKKFLWTVRGRWKSFWLPTWRADLVATAIGTGTLTVSGDALAWYPAQRSYLATYTSAMVPTYLKIASAVDNLNGTVTLSVVDGAGTPVTLGALPAMTCWLEPCHLESDEVSIQFKDFQFAMTLQAHVIQDYSATVTPGFFTEESSIESSLPREGIEFIISGVRTYRVSTGTRDLTINGFTYTAYPANREEVGVITSGDAKDVTVRVPLKHAVPQRYLQGGVPPKRVQVNIYRQQQASAAYELVFSGDVDSMGAEGRVAMLRCRASVNRLMQTRLPVLTVGRSCAHILYDKNCRLDENSFKLSTTVVDVDGRKVTMALTLPDDYATAGKIKHTASGEQMTILSQLGTVVTMQLAIPDLKVGDAIDVFAGCDHTIRTCRLKFNNKPNFGGYPQLITVNPFGPKNNGIYTAQ